MPIAKGHHVNEQVTKTPSWASLYFSKRINSHINEQVTKTTGKHIEGYLHIEKSSMLCKWCNDTRGTGVFRPPSQCPFFHFFPLKQITVANITATYDGCQHSRSAWNSQHSRDSQCLPPLAIETSSRHGRTRKSHSTRTDARVSDSIQQRKGQRTTDMHTITCILTTFKDPSTCRKAQHRARKHID